MLKIKEISLQEREYYNKYLLNFEKSFSYPLGSDRFRIKHGSYYFTFFDRIGDAKFLIAEHDKQIVAICAAVLRKLTIDSNKDPKFVWYICDLKVHPDYQNLSIVQSILRYGYKKYSKISTSCYGVSMNSNTVSNRMVNFASRIPLLKLSAKQQLNFYLLSKSQGAYAQRFILRNSFISLANIKDLILASTKQPLEFMHFTNSINIKTAQILVKNNISYMVCWVDSSVSDLEFKKNGLQPVATATIIANFTPDNWDFIKTHEI